MDLNHIINLIMSFAQNTPGDPLINQNKNQLLFMMHKKLCINCVTLGEGLDFSELLLFYNHRNVSKYLHNISLGLFLNLY